MNDEQTGNDPHAVVPENGRRDFLKKGMALSGAAALRALVPPGVRQAAWAAGSDAPELAEVKIGFILETSVDRSSGYLTAWFK